MDRWQRLETLAVEFEQFGRLEERERWAGRVSGLETRLESALKRVSDTERALQRENQIARRLQEEIARLLPIEREASKLRKRVVAVGLSLLGGRDGLLTACDRGDAQQASTFLEPVLNSAEDDSLVQEILDEALRTAAGGDFLDACNMLLHRGADPTSRDGQNGQNALHRAVICPGQTDHVLLCLMQPDWVRDRVNDLDASGASPLTLAVQLLKVDRMMCLVSFGADASLVSREDWKRLNDFQVRQAAEAAASSSSSLAAAVSSPSTAASPASSAASSQEEISNNHPHILTEGKQNKKDNNVGSLEQQSERAGDLYKAGRFQEALAIYMELDKRTHTNWTDVNRATLFYNAARTAARLEEHCLAAEWCDRILQLLPDSREALMQRADSKMRVFDYARAVIDYETLAHLAAEHEQQQWLKQASRARARLHALENFYDLLGLDSSCTQAQVRKAYLKKCLEWHPDKNRGSRDGQAKAGVVFKALTEAHSVLSDTVKRIDYDAKSLLRSVRRSGSFRTQGTEDENEEDAGGEEEEEDGLSEFDENGNYASNSKNNNDSTDDELAEDDDEDEDAKLDSAFFRPMQQSRGGGFTSPPAPRDSSFRSSYSSTAASENHLRW